MNNNVVEYIRVNQDVYTREAIDERLRAEGYTEEEIEDGWRQMPPLQPAPSQPGPPVRALSRGDVTALVILTLFLGLIGLVLVGLTDLVLGMSGSSASGTQAALLAFVNLGSLAVLVALLVVGTWLVRNKGWSAGKLAGLILAVAVVWYLIVLGTCLNGPNLF